MLNRFLPVAMSVFLWRGLVGSAAFGQILYSGESTARSGITLGSWGSGTAQDTSAVFTGGGSHSIAITGQGLYAGGRLDFANPVAIPTRAEDTYLVFTLRPALERRTTAESSAALSSDEDIPVLPKANNFRIVLQGEGGQMCELQEPLGYHKVTDGWIQLGIPLKAIPFPAKNELGSSSAVSEGGVFHLERLAVFLDTVENFNVGRIELLKDQTPIHVEPLETAYMAARETARFIALADDGTSSLIYTWDFDDADGPTEDAVGPVVTHQYGREGEYKGTLWVTDVHRLKDQAVVHFNVHVDP